MRALEATLWFLRRSKTQTLNLKPNPSNPNSKSSHSSLQALQNMTQLLHLNLSNCSLGSHGARVLSTVIPFVSKLQSLYLTHNHIFGRSMHRICATISSLTDIRLLDLSNNSLEEQGARDLSRSLRYCRMLTHLCVP